MTFLISRFNTFLNERTMYRLALEGLLALALISVVFGFFGLIPYGGISLIGSFFFLSGVCYGANRLFAKIVRAPVTNESAPITALILFFILTPATDISGYNVLLFAGVLAMASKYILAINRKHVFNPAAFSLVVLGICGVSRAVWWIGSPLLLPFVILLGLLVLKKIRKFTLFFSFAIASIGAILWSAHSLGAPLLDTFMQIFLSWPLLFFGTIMLTEPGTMPPKPFEQRLYAVIVGILFGFQFHVGPLVSTPELALIVGNMYSFFVSPRYTPTLTLREKKPLANSTYEFTFSSSHKMSHRPGQYVEWTLPHAKADTRGVRRHFTIASSPTEEHIKLTVRASREKGSSFKKHLLGMQPGDTITASRLAGDFVLPRNLREKVAFIAGGIGITPFRSMIQYLLDRGEERSIVMLYANKTAHDIAYKELFDLAERKLGIKTVHVLSAESTHEPGMRSGLIDTRLIAEEIPDYRERTFYISGPEAMVSAFKKILSSMGVSRFKIKSDFFPGF